MSGKLDGRSYAGTLKNFQSTHIGYRAHRAVIFAIAWHLVIIIIMIIKRSAFHYVFVDPQQTNALQQCSRSACEAQHRVSKFGGWA